MFLILLNLAISFNSSIDFLYSFWAWFNSFSEIFCNLVKFSSPILDIFLFSCLLSCLLCLFINFLVDIFWGSLIPLFFSNELIFFSRYFYHFILRQKKIIILKKVIILIIWVYMHSLFIHMMLFIDNFKKGYN